MPPPRRRTSKVQSQSRRRAAPAPPDSPPLSSVFPPDVPSSSVSVESNIDATCTTTETSECSSRHTTSLQYGEVFEELRKTYHDILNGLHSEILELQIKLKSLGGNIRPKSTVSMSKNQTVEDLSTAREAIQHNKKRIKELRKQHSGLESELARVQLKLREKTALNEQAQQSAQAAMRQLEAIKTFVKSDQSVSVLNSSTRERIEQSFSADTIATDHPSSPNEPFSVSDHDELEKESRDGRLSSGTKKIFNGKRKMVSCSPSTTSPYSPSALPSIIRCCIAEVEKRGLHHKGIYRDSGSIQQMNFLRKKFLRSSVPDISEEKIVNIAGLLKLYLRERKVPIVPSSLYYRIHRCVENRNEGLQDFLRANLSHENYCILIHLANHLRKVTANKSSNRMSLLNICNVFAPILLPEKGSGAFDKTIVRRQHNILKGLLSLPQESWESSSAKDAGKRRRI